MTEISFYTRATDKLAIARQLVAKARAQKLNVMLYAPDPMVAANIDRLLWSHPALSFLPHCRDTDALASQTPILIGTEVDSLASPDVMINLGDDPPAAFSRFSRLLEIVTDEAEDLGKGRQRYKFYRDRGYELTNHDLQGRG